MHVVRSFTQIFLTFKVKHIYSDISLLFPLCFTILWQTPLLTTMVCHNMIGQILGSLGSLLRSLTKFLKCMTYAKRYNMLLIFKLYLYENNTRKPNKASVPLYRISLGFILDTHLDARPCRNTSGVDRGSLLSSTYNLFRATWCMAF